MKLNEDNLEQLLRQAPQPRPPANLKKDLLARIALPRASGTGVVKMKSNRHTRSLRLWWTTALAASLVLASLGLLAFQQWQINELRQNMETIQADHAAAKDPLAEPVNPTAGRGTSASRPAVDPRAELESLRKTVAELSPEIVRLENLAAENERLQQTLANSATLADSELEQVQAAQEKAQRIMCVNNLKQLGLAARIFATDHQDRFPPDLLSMTNEMSTPKILFCPGDTARQAASNWSTFTAASCSYEYLAPSAPETEPQRVLFRCPIHGNVALCDGSVQQVGNSHPERFETRDGKLYLEN